MLYDSSLKDINALAQFFVVYSKRLHFHADVVERCTLGAAEQTRSIARSGWLRIPGRRVGFAAVIGEVVADLLADGGTPHDIAFLSLLRFTSNEKPGAHAAAIDKNGAG